MADQPIAIDGIDDRTQVRVMLYQSGKTVHAPLEVVAPAQTGDFSGPASSVVDDIVSFADTTGKLGKDSGVKVTSVVVGPASAVADDIATFNGTTGKLVKDSGIAVSSLAPKASPTFTGTPAAPTAAPGTNTTQLATTAFVALKADLASPTFTGDPKAPTAAPGDNDTSIATTAFVAAAMAAFSPDYGAGNAALAYGTIGTYVLAGKTATTGFADNSTFAGSTLKPVGFGVSDAALAADTISSGNANVSYGSSALSGTWRAMGRAIWTPAAGNDFYATLFLRIS